MMCSLGATSGIAGGAGGSACVRYDLVVNWAQRDDTLFRESNACRFDECGSDRPAAPLSLPRNVPHKIGRNFLDHNIRRDSSVKGQTRFRLRKTPNCRSLSVAL